MAILITGGAGYIGSHMVYELADRGEQPVVIDDFSSGFEWAIPADVPVFVGDIGDQQRVAPLIAKYGISEICCACRRAGPSASSKDHPQIPETQSEDLCRRHCPQPRRH